MDSPHDDGLPLSGVTVIEVSQVLTGAYASMVLADLGADVIKVERPEGGDVARAYGPPDVDDTSYYFWSVNRNKRSVTLDLTSDAGRASLHALIAGADVLVHNALPRTVAKLGIDAATLRAVNPRLVHCGISGFGSDTDQANRAALDIVLQAASGMMSITGEPGGDPLRSPAPVADISAGLFASTSILAALFERQRTGEGRSIEVSMVQTAAALLPYHWGEWFVDGQVPQRQGNDHPAIVPYGCYATRDGHVVLAINSDVHWRTLCEVLDLDELATDPAFATNAARIANRDQVLHRVRESFALRTTAQVVAPLEARGVPCCEVRDFAAVDRDATVRFDVLERSDGASAPVVASPIRLANTPARAASAPPRLGQDNDTTAPLQSSAEGESAS